jgi:hypothetical protein
VIHWNITPIEHSVFPFLLLWDIIAIHTITANVINPMIHWCNYYLNIWSCLSQCSFSLTTSFVLLSIYHTYVIFLYLTSNIATYMYSFIKLLFQSINYEVSKWAWDKKSYVFLMMSSLLLSTVVIPTIIWTHMMTCGLLKRTKASKASPSS